MMPDAGFACCGGRDWETPLREDGSEPEVEDSVTEDPGADPAEDRLRVVVVGILLLLFLGAD